MARAVAPGASPWVRAVQITRKVPRAVRVMPQVDLACREVAPMFVESFGLPASIGALFEYVDERWDGKGAPGAKGEEIPLAMRIAQVARDIDVQRVLGGAELAARIVGERAGSAFDPAIAACFVDEAKEMLAVDDEASVWDPNRAFRFSRLRRPNFCPTLPSRGASRYEKRAARFRRFSIAAARLARTAGVERASTIACLVTHFDRSTRVILRITSCPDATCSRTCSSFA